RRTIDVALDRCREVARPAAAPKLAVAQHVDAGRFLHLDARQDGLVLYVPHLVGGQLALGLGPVGVQHLLRAQEAAYLVGAIRGCHNAVSKLTKFSKSRTILSRRANLRPWPAPRKAWTALRWDPA